jgi:hypothetical protein
MLMGMKCLDIEYRKQFVTRYLHYKCCAHQWTQIMILEAMELEQMGCIKPNSGY